MPPSTKINNITDDAVLPMIQCGESKRNSRKKNEYHE